MANNKKETRTLLQQGFKFAKDAILASSTGKVLIIPELQFLICIVDNNMVFQSDSAHAISLRFGCDGIDYRKAIDQWVYSSGSKYHLNVTYCFIHDKVEHLSKMRGYTLISPPQGIHLSGAEIQYTFINPSQKEYYYAGRFLRIEDFLL